MTETYPLIERMAEAINDTDLHGKSLEDMARAALAAALEGMQEPSAGMVVVGHLAYSFPPEYAKECWQAMLDQLAKEVLGE